MSNLLACLEVAFRRIGGLVGSFARQGERLSAGFTRIGGIDCSFERVGSPLEVTFTRVGKMSCAFGLVCRTSIGDEDVLWASDGIVINKLGDKIYITRKG